MIEKFKKSSSKRLFTWVVTAVMILNARGNNISLKVGAK